MQLKRLTAAALALTLACAGVVTSIAPVPAAAETSSEIRARLDEAKKKRDELYLEVERRYEELADTEASLAETQSQMDGLRTQIDQTQGNIDSATQKIAVKEREVAEDQDELSDVIVADYKSGGLNLLDIILRATDFDDLVSKTHYAQKVSEHQTEVIADLQSKKAELEGERQDLEAQKGVLEEQNAQLEAQRQEQQTLLESQRQQQAALQQQASEADAYMNNLDQELKDKIAEEDAAQREAARRAAEAAQRQLQNQSSGGGYSSGGSSGSGGSSWSGSSGSSSGGSTSYDGDGITQAQRDTILNAAYSMVGRTTYVLGARDPEGLVFDCSGLTSWAYSQAGLTLPRTSAQQREITNVVSISQLTPGDLVFWYGHVAIYAGDNQIIESLPGRGVVLNTIWGSPIGGGQPF